MVFLAIARAMVHTRSNPRLCKSYIWNLARGVNGNRIFLSKFFIVFLYFRNVSKERLRRRPLWREVARTKVKKTTFVFCKLFHTQSSSLDSVYFVSSRHTRLYVVLNAMCFLIPFVRCSWLLFLTFRWSFLRTVIQTPKASRLPSRKTFKKTMQSTLTKFTAPRGLCSSHTSIDCCKSCP